MVAMRAVLAVGLICAALIADSLAFTQPSQLEKLMYFRDAMRERSSHWRSATGNWECPTPDGGCDPCGTGIFGNWHHMFCRGLTPGKDGDGTIDGWVTNIHLSDLRIDGPIPRELCLLTELRELDLDGGRLTGPIPEFLSTCFPRLAEFDLSFNRLSGTLPAFFRNLDTLQEVELRVNRLIGTLPPELGDMPALRELEIDGNSFTGSIPNTFRKLNRTMTSILINDNNLEGDLSALAKTPLMKVGIHNNAKLCGMVPASVRFAHGYNPSGTRLGQPC